MSPRPAYNPVVAHRGAWKKNSFPENSIASLRRAVGEGFAGSEFDVRMTADDTLIIIHDPVFSGKVIEKTTFKELSDYTLSNGEKIPTLREYISEGLKKNTGTKLFCEIKPSDISKQRSVAVAEKVIQQAKDLKALSRMVFISFDYDVLKKIVQIEPSAQTQYLESDRSPEQLKKDGISGADYHYSVYQEHPEWIDYAKKNGVALNVWTVNEDSLLDWAVSNRFDYITTNEPELLASKLLEVFAPHSDTGNTSKSSSEKNKTFDEKELSVRWELKSNSPVSVSVITIKNKSRSFFPVNGWCIYFNSSRDIIDTVSSGIHVKHFNGDIYTLSPAGNFRGIPFDESVQITYKANGELLNYTGAPSGMYIVWDHDPFKGFTIQDFVLTSINDSLVKGMTPKKIFEKNKDIIDIPDKELVKIFPTPVSYKENEGEFILDADCKIIAENYFKQESDYLTSELNHLLGRKKSNTKINKTGRSIFLKRIALAEGAYQLNVYSDKIEINASSGEGIFYGIQSLRSLLPATAWKNTGNRIAIPCVEVFDMPRFGYRSLMIDVARNFKSKSQILKMIDLMAMYKLNILHFHLIDDEGWRLEIPSLPELTEVGSKRGHTTDSKKMLPASYGAGPDTGKSLASGFYTRKDFIEILKYAKERHISVIPEIESPGHSRAAIKSMDVRYERLMQTGKKAEAEKFLLRDPEDKSIYSSAQNWTDNVMCVALPSTYQFAEKVLDEIIAMYREAGATLTTVHFGGDEVPAGAWERSPACQQFIRNNPKIKNTDDLWYYYYSEINKLVKSRNLTLAGWEEIALRKTMVDGERKYIPNPDFVQENFQTHVWNNMIGWGSEDLPYRLANAGYKVILSCVSNNYLDLAYYRSADEPGYYWGGFQDIDKPFYFVPFDYYKTTREDAAGRPADLSNFAGKDKLTDYGKTNILGIQGLLWSENIRSNEQMEYMLLPKLLALAERAWAQDPQWAIEKDKLKSNVLYNRAWSEFVNVLGKREMPKLDYLSGGFAYRIPTVGVVSENGEIKTNIQFPGLIIRYTTDGTEPTRYSKIFPGSYSEKGEIKIRAFNDRGRGGRTVTVMNN